MITLSSPQGCEYVSLTIKRVRVAAAESMPLLLECARVRGPEYLTQMWHFMCDALIKAIGTEPDSDVLSEIMHSFAKVNIFLFQKIYIRLCVRSITDDLPVQFFCFNISVASFFFVFFSLSVVTLVFWS